MKSFTWSIVVCALVGVVCAQREAWDADNAAIQINCADDSVSNTEIDFQGFLDTCGNEEQAPFGPEAGQEQLDLVIDPRNADVIMWDTDRYKRYGTYSPNTHMDWNIPEGFNNLYTKVFYVEKNYQRFGYMRYQGSVDGETWEDLDEVTYSSPECTTNEGCFYELIEENMSFSTTYFHFRAYWPPPCQSELDEPNVRSCLTITDVEEDKDLYYAPQLGELVLGAKSTAPGVVTSLQATAAAGSIEVTWDAPNDDGGLEITGYVVYYRVDSPLLALDDDYAPPYNSLRRNVGNVKSVTLSNVDASRTYIVQVRAINSGGSGMNSRNVWATPLEGEMGELTCVAPEPVSASASTTSTPTPSTQAPVTSNLEPNAAESAESIVSSAQQASVGMFVFCSTMFVVCLSMFTAM